MERREFLAGSMGATLLAALPADLMAQAGSAPRPMAWDPGRVRHLLHTVSDTRMLIKHLDMREQVSPIEQHGFTLVDFLPDRIALRFFNGI